MSASETPPKLYAAHEPVFPRRVSGVFRNLKWWIMGVTLGIYYILPWVRWDRGSSLSDQAVLVDLANRRFFFFWVEIWPHEFYFIAGLLIMAGLGLFLFTSALGRVWCGYTCPQTVWTDLFILVERWIDGDRNARVRLWNAKWSLRKARLRATKWIVWLLISVATGGAWVFYFTDAPTLLGNLWHGTAHPVAYTTILILTLTTFVFGGFMREQICIYMCPWPRIQAAMMDEDTLLVAYRHWRGEPRGKLHKKTADVDVEAAAQGDCIDCMACVNVCPVGIDIRDGQQLECITCALCIDACDEVMDRIGKPRGLIDYMALTDEIAEMDGKTPRSILKHVLRPRTILYSVLWASVGLGLVFALFIRGDIDFVVSPVRNPIFVTLSDGSIRNTYDIRLRNKHGDATTFAITATSDADVDIIVEGQDDGIVVVDADSTFSQKVHIVAENGSAAATMARTDVRLWIEDVSNQDRAYKDTIFNGNSK